MSKLFGVPNWFTSKIGEIAIDVVFLIIAIAIIVIIIDLSTVFGDWRQEKLIKKAKSMLLKLQKNEELSISVDNKEINSLYRILKKIRMFAKDCSCCDDCYYDDGSRAMSEESEKNCLNLTTLSKLRSKIASTASVSFSEYKILS